MVLGFTQPLTEMTYRNVTVGVERGRRVRMTTSPPSVSILTRNCVSVDISQPNLSLRPVTRIASLYLILHNRNVQVKPVRQFAGHQNCDSEALGAGGGVWQLIRDVPLL
jgi:hypothetical protein